MAETPISPINGLEFAPEWVGTPIHFRCCQVRDYFDSLPAQEAALVEQSAPLRRNTFSSGRHCARQLLEKLGQSRSALRRKEDGSIEWPEGFIGSVSHTNDWAVAGVAAQALTEALSFGIDLERIRPIGQPVLKHIATQKERTDLESAGPLDWHATALFGLKESIYKCLRPSFGSFIRFHDVEITEIASGRPQLSIIGSSLSEHCASKDIELRLGVTPEHVFSLAWRRDAQQ